eukprot:CAMPEP_0196154450 /NCGR_PEP_ID=MMETSP0910-20130528/38899_1 /TAXON_ID=49265 /ORGANISM="Thalassiosira rotula, Strain GSO102" /LENGTH=111 /DNA_ID=CAMNT_0041418467 /DNA_START=204 /DNA_END=539 /DNA_ORIENTATION=-
MTLAHGPASTIPHVSKVLIWVGTATVSTQKTADIKESIAKLRIRIVTTEINDIGAVTMEDYAPVPGMGVCVEIPFRGSFVGIFSVVARRGHQGHIARTMAMSVSRYKAMLV